MVFGSCKYCELCRDRMAQNGHTVTGVRSMNTEKPDKRQQALLEEQRSLNRFNSITQKVKPENQNQQHNVREEGIGPVNQKR